MDAGALLIATYLPGELSRREIGEMEVDEFIHCCSKAIYARSMRRDDIKHAVLEAVNELFGN